MSGEEPGIYPYKAFELGLLEYFEWDPPEDVYFETIVEWARGVGVTQCAYFGDNIDEMIEPPEDLPVVMYITTHDQERDAWPLSDNAVFYRGGHYAGIYFTSKSTAMMFKLAFDEDYIHHIQRDEEGN